MTKFLDWLLTENSNPLGDLILIGGIVLFLHLQHIGHTFAVIMGWLFLYFAVFQTTNGFVSQLWKMKRKRKGRKPMTEPVEL